MNKKQIGLLVLVIIVVVLAVDLIVGNYISARLATTSWARKWGLFNTQAPIVVTNRETVRVNTNNDLVETAENAKTRTAALVYYDGDNMVVSGSAVNWTSDGYFMTAKSALSAAGKVYAVVTSNGDVYPVEASFVDPASELVVLQTSAKDLTVYSPVEPRDLRVGQQMVMIENSLTAGQARFYTGYIKRLTLDVSGAIANSDLVSRNIELTLSEPIPVGSAVLNLSGRLVGIWDGTKVVPSEEAQELMNNLFANQKTIVRPNLGFSYQILNELEAKALQLNPGARVAGVEVGGPASRGGLKAGDIITEIDGQKLDASTNFDQLFRKVKPTQVLSLTVSRGSNTLSILITAQKL